MSDKVCATSVRTGPAMHVLHVMQKHTCMGEVMHGDLQHASYATHDVPHLCFEQKDVLRREGVMMMGRGAAGRTAQALPNAPPASTVSLPVKNNEILSDMLATVQSFRQKIDGLKASQVHDSIPARNG
eukprot:352421-Chlamydomonas_euryale.AAC.29